MWKKERKKFVAALPKVYEEKTEKEQRNYEKTVKMLGG